MYTPKDFDPDKMHCLKYLWIFERRAELIAAQLEDCSFEERVNMLPKAFMNATERVQMETGLSTDDLRKALFVGTYIAEFREIEKMDDEERESYISFVEGSRGVPEEVLEMFGVALEELEEALDPERLYDDFNQIIKENFNDTE